MGLRSGCPRKSLPAVARLVGTPSLELPTSAATPDFRRESQAVPRIATGHNVLNTPVGPCSCFLIVPMNRALESRTQICGRVGIDAELLEHHFSAQEKAWDPGKTGFRISGEFTSMS